MPVASLNSPKISAQTTSIQRQQTISPEENKAIIEGRCVGNISSSYPEHFSRMYSESASDNSQNNGTKNRKLKSWRAAKHSELEEALLLWFNDACCQNISVGTNYMNICESYAYPWQHLLKWRVVALSKTGLLSHVHGCMFLVRISRPTQPSPPNLRVLDLSLKYETLTCPSTAHRNLSYRLASTISCTIVARPKRDWLMPPFTISSFWPLEQHQFSEVALCLRAVFLATCFIAISNAILRMQA